MIQKVTLTPLVKSLIEKFHLNTLELNSILNTFEPEDLGEESDLSGLFNAEQFYQFAHLLYLNVFYISAANRLLSPNEHFQAAYTECMERLSDVFNAFLQTPELHILKSMLTLAPKDVCVQYTDPLSIAAPKTLEQLMTHIDSICTHCFKIKK